MYQWLRHGAERFWQWWEHCNFSRYSLFLRRSAPLLASIIGTFPSSNRAERNAFDNVPLMKNNLTEHCIMLHGSFIFPRSAPFRSVLRWCWLRYLNIVKCPWTFLISPLRSVLQWWWVTHLNIGICSLHFYYFPSPFPYCYCNSYQSLNEKIIFLTFFMIPPVFVMLKL